MLYSNLREHLKNHGVLPTVQRIQIARTLFSKNQHLSADQVLQQVRKNGGDVSKATVYNTLNIFSKKGLLKELVLDPSRTYYDSNTTEHHHLYNTSTGELIDVDPGAISIAKLPDIPEECCLDSVEVIVKIRPRSDQ